MTRTAGTRLACVVVSLAHLACARSPHALARQVSGLSIPSDATVLSFKDEASGLVGEDLFARAELEVTESSFASLVSQAQRSGYRPVVALKSQPLDPINEFGVSERGISEAAAEVSAESGSLFRYIRHSASAYSLVVLDAGRHRIVVQSVIL